MAAKAARERREKDRQEGMISRRDIIGGLIAAKFSKETGMAKYSKLFGAVIGGVVGWGAAWLALHVPFIASCVGDVCTVLGLSEEQIVAALTMLFVAIGVERAPKNAA